MISYTRMPNKLFNAAIHYALMPQSEITDYRLFMSQSTRYRFYNDVIMSVDRVKVTSFISIFNTNFQRRFVKTVHKGKNTMAQFLKCVFSQSEIQIILPIPILNR